MIFSDYAADDMAQHMALSCSPTRVLEMAAGTGIVTRLLRDRSFRKRGATDGDRPEPADA